MGERRPPAVGIVLIAGSVFAGVFVAACIYWWITAIGWIGAAAGLVIALSLSAAGGVVVFLLVEGIKRLLGRGEIADVANEETRALIDGEGRRSDPPPPAAEATRINAAFRGLINASDVDDLQHLDRFFVNGNDS